MSKTHFTYMNSPLGKLLLTAKGKYLTGIYYENHQYPCDLSDAEESNEHPVLQHAIAGLNGYFKRHGSKTFDVPIKPEGGTSFQKSVWRALQKIPFGETVSYGDIAKKIRKPKAVRAVGAAVGKNPLSIIIPCHRVIGSNGKITGYAGGIERKIQLLAIEGSLEQVKP